VYYGGKEEGYESGICLAHLVGVDTLQVHMAQQEFMHWLVPFSGKLIKRFTAVC
jgi:hypothetical protein